MRMIPYRKSDLPSTMWPEVSSLLDGVFSGPIFSSVKANHNWLPAVDILEKDGNLMLRVEVPGINEKDIDLKLEGNVLTLKGEKKLEEDGVRGEYYRLESYFGAFSRSFTLPESADRDQIKAEFKNGILTITVPQRPEVKPRDIPVSTK